MPYPLCFHIIHFVPEWFYLLQIDAVVTSEAQNKQRPLLAQGIRDAVEPRLRHAMLWAYTFSLHFSVRVLLRSRGCTVTLLAWLKGKKNQLANMSLYPSRPLSQTWFCLSEEMRSGFTWIWLWVFLSQHEGRGRPWERSCTRQIFVWWLDSFGSAAARVPQPPRGKHTSWNPFHQTRMCVCALSDLVLCCTSRSHAQPQLAVES